jgi:hypothetical protein
MPNTEIERLMAKSALSQIQKKYSGYIEDNPFFKNLFTGGNTNFDIHVKFMDEPAFIMNFRLTGLIPSNCTLNGFFDPRTQTIFINRTKAPNSTLVHEFLHALTHPNFHKFVSCPMVEGVTEYFTRKIQKVKQKKLTELTDEDIRNAVIFSGERYSYPEEFKKIQTGREFIKTYGQFIAEDQNISSLDGYMKRAYFLGDISMIGIIKQHIEIS